MKLTLSLVLPLVLLLLAACASFDPYHGMPYADFEHNAGLAGQGGAELVGRNGSTTVYYLNGATDHDVYYWFEFGMLNRVTRGTLPQIRHQLKAMYKAPPPGSERPTVPVKSKTSGKKKETTAMAD